MIKRNSVIPDYQFRKVGNQDKIRPLMSSAGTAARLRMEGREGGRVRPQIQFIDKVMDIRPPIPEIIHCSCDHAEVSVSSSSGIEKTVKIRQNAVREVEGHGHRRGKSLRQSLGLSRH